MLWFKLVLAIVASTFLNAAFMFKAPEYAVISGVIFAFAIGIN